MEHCIVFLADPEQSDPRKKFLALVLGISFLELPEDAGMEILHRHYPEISPDCKILMRKPLPETLAGKIIADLFKEGDGGIISDLLSEMGGLAHSFAKETIPLTS